MKLAPRLRLHLQAMGVPYDVKRHRRTATASATAEAAHVPGAQLAKSVLLRDAEGYVLAVLSSTQHVELDLLNGALGRDLQFATEAEAAGVFFDCRVGALPVTGSVYGAEVIVDSAFGGSDDVYVEAGDHEHVLKLTGADFARLMRLARRVDFAVYGPAGHEPPPKKPAPKSRKRTASPPVEHDGGSAPA